MSTPPPGQPIVQIRTPETLTAGVYANGLFTSSTRHEFTLDFMVNLPPEQGVGPDGQPAVLVPQQVVARVKIPPALVYEVMRDLNGMLDAYEKKHGKVPDFSGPQVGGQSDAS